MPLIGGPFLIENPGNPGGDKKRTFGPGGGGGVCFSHRSRDEAEAEFELKKTSLDRQPSSHLRGITLSKKNIEKYVCRDHDRFFGDMFDT